MTTRIKLPIVVMAALALGVMAGCGGQPQEYFRLSAASGDASPAAGGPAVGVGPVALPGYIDRAQLVYQSGTNEFQVPGKASWAGPLGENVTQVIADDLGQHLRSANVLSFPWAPNSRLRYQVVVNVEQFHSISGADAILEVSWLVEEPTSRQILSRHRASFHSTVHGDGYAPVVAAESDLLDQLAAAVARSLKS